jgi:hypothetical protein
MAVIDINWNPNRRELKQFALLQIVFFGIVSTILFRKNGGTATAATLFAASACIGAVGFWAPLFIRPIYVVWMAVVFPIGWVVSHVLLAAIYFLAFAPLGLLMRLCGRNPIAKEFDRGATSYWIRRTPPEGSKGYFRQF